MTRLWISILFEWKCHQITVESKQANIVTLILPFNRSPAFLDGKKPLASWEQLIGESILIEFKLSFAVNFSNGKSIKFQFI